VGCLAAPYGHISIAFMTAVGIPTLMAWDGAVCREALAMYKVCWDLVGGCASLGYTAVLTCTTKWARCYTSVKAMTGTTMFVPFAHALLMLQVSRVLPPVCTASQAEALALMSQRSSEGYLVEMLEGLLLVAFAK
jgi:hypothetical protein